MHPDLMIEVNRQHIRDMRSQAREAGLVRSLRQAMRARRSGRAADVPAIPDYVSEMFEETSVSHPVA
jgi:hypothetical protein